MNGKIDDLARAARDCGDDFVRARIDVVRLVLAGFDDRQVENMTGHTAGTIREIVRRFDAQGVDGLRDRRTRARPLTAEQVSVIRGFIRARRAAGEHTSAAALDRFVRERWDRRLSRRRATALLVETGA